MFYLPLYFPRSWKGQGSKIRGDAERSHVLSSPLIYWKSNIWIGGKRPSLQASWHGDKSSKGDVNSHKINTANPRSSAASQVQSYCDWPGLLPRDKGKENVRTTQVTLSLESSSRGGQEGLPGPTQGRKTWAVFLQRWRGVPHYLQERKDMAHMALLQDPVRQEGWADAAGVKTNAGWNQALETRQPSLPTGITASGPRALRLSKTYSLNGISYPHSHHSMYLIAAVLSKSFYSACDF